MNVYVNILYAWCHSHKREQVKFDNENKFKY